MTGSYPLNDVRSRPAWAYDPKLNLLISSCSNHIAKAIDAGTGAIWAQ